MNNVRETVLKATIAKIFLDLKYGMPSSITLMTCVLFFEPILEEILKESGADSIKEELLLEWLVDMLLFIDRESDKEVDSAMRESLVKSLQVFAEEFPVSEDLRDKFEALRQGKDYTKPEVDLSLFEESLNE